MQVAQKKKATALLAGHGLSRPTFKSKNGKKGKQKKRCATKDCKNVVKVHFHKFCDACFSSRKEKSSADDSSALNDVPAAVRENNHASKINSLKKKMAQISSIKNKAKRDGLLKAHPVHRTPPACAAAKRATYSDPPP